MGSGDMLPINNTGMIVVVSQIFITLVFAVVFLGIFVNMIELKFKEKDINHR
jgi:hypothetical protein